MPEVSFASPDNSTLPTMPHYIDTRSSSQKVPKIINENDQDESKCVSEAWFYTETGAWGSWHASVTTADPDLF